MAEQRLIDANIMEEDESEAYISAQTSGKISPITQGLNSVVHRKIQQLIADTPTIDPETLPIVQELRAANLKAECRADALMAKILVLETELKQVTAERDAAIKELDEVTSEVDVPCKEHVGCEKEKMKMDAVKFLKETYRMCKMHIDCSGCPIANEENGFCTLLDEQHFDLVVKNVEKWSKEHPLKTRKEDFFEKFPNAKRARNDIPAVCTKLLGYDDEKQCKNTTCKECWNQPIER